MRRFQEFSYVIVSQVLFFVLTIFFIKQISNELTKEDFGQYVLISAIVSVSNSLLFGGLTNAVIRFYKEKQINDQLNEFYVSIIHYFLFISFLLSVTWIVLNFVFGLESSIINFFEIISILVLLISVNSIFLNLLNARILRINYSVMFIVDPIIKVAAVFLFSIYAIDLTFNLLIKLLIFSQSFVLAINLLSVKDIPRYLIKVNGPSNRELFDYSAPISIWSIFVSTANNSDKFFLARFSSLGDVAGYSLLYQYFFSPILIGLNSLITFITPMFVDKWSILENRRLILSLIRKLTLLMLSMGIIQLLSVFIFESEVKLLLGVKYEQYAKYFTLFILAGVFQFAHHFIGIQVVLLKLPKMVMKFHILFSVLNIISNYFAIKEYGFNGAVLILVLFSILSFGWIWINLKQHHDKG